MIGLEDIVMPPAPPHLQRQRQSIIRFLAGATAVAGMGFLLITMGVGIFARMVLERGQPLLVIFWLVLLVMIYVCVGTALCAAFMSRLRLWGGAPLSKVVAGKLNFVRGWPWAAPRLLRHLIIDRLTGGGGGAPFMLG